MNEIKSFSFYRNYYELIKYLPDNDRLELYDAILNYIFESIEINNNANNQIITHDRLREKRVCWLTTVRKSHRLFLA